VDIKEQLDLIQKSLESKAAGDAKNAAEAAVAELKGKLETAEIKAADAVKEATELKKMVEELKSAAEKNQPVIDAFVINGKKTPLAGQQESKSFNQVLAEIIDANANEIKNFKKGAPEAKFELKTVGDMSIAANFANAGSLYSDRQSQLIQSPYNRVWLGDVLPNGTSSGTSLIYPKENGGEGGAGVWEDPTTDKPQIDFDLTSQTSFFKWLAGIVIVDREMLDDITFLTSYIQNKMLISLKTAENAFILNGTASTNPVTGLLGAATAYNGSLTGPVDRIIDAAYGQIVEDTFGFYNPTTVVATPREAVNKLGLNKASGSGEYNLPEGSVAFSNGKLTIGGLELVTTTSVTANNFIAFDKSATMFVKRMQPELRLFEDAALAKRNKVMFRVEEKATLAIFNNKAIVKGLLTPP
jgi:HK97 family phage major capsid protein